MSVDATVYGAPRGSFPPGRSLGLDEHRCLRVALTVATVYVYPWGVRPATNYAHVQRGDGLETAHLAPRTVDALIQVGTIVESVDLLSSPSWPMIDERQ